MVGWAGGGEERVLGEGKGCNASIAEFSGVKAQSVLPLPGCHHKPIKKAAQAGLICFNSQKYISPSLLLLTTQTQTDHWNNILFFLN